MTGLKYAKWVIAAGVVVIVCIYFLFDPSESGWMPRCGFKVLTGWDCPGCGSQRMIHALLHGDVPRAWNENAFLTCSLPFLAVMALSASKRKTWPRLYAFLNSLPMIVAITVALIGWTILRNVSR